MKFVDAQGESYSPRKYLTFNDVLLMPQYSRFNSRNHPDINVSTSLCRSPNSALHKLKIPIISSNMDTVTESKMAHAIGDLGGIGILHRFHKSEEDYMNCIKEVQESFSMKLCFSIGCNNEQINWIDFVKKVFDRHLEIVGDINYCNLSVCLDVAHAHSLQSLLMIKSLRKTFTEENLTIIAGNVASGEAAIELVQNGASILKVGIGNGSCCTTRIVTGHGVPQLTAIMQVRNALDQEGYNHIGIIADGGIRQSGDAVKAFAAGADAVMLGQILAGTEETPGEVIHYGDGSLKKIYRGQSSRHFMNDIGKVGVAAEGVSTSITYKGKVKEVVDEFVGGIRSGLTYSGANSLENLRYKAVFMEISEHGWNESVPHVLTNAL